MSIDDFFTTNDNEGAENTDAPLTFDELMKQYGTDNSNSLVGQFIEEDEYGFFDSRTPEEKYMQDIANMELMEWKIQNGYVDYDCENDGDPYVDEDWDSYRDNNGEKEKNDNDNPNDDEQGA